ncbi:MAG: C1 family peptidase [Pseudomonadota bacterium]
MKKYLLPVLVLIALVPKILVAQEAASGPPIKMSTGAIKMSPEEYLKIEKVKMVRSFTSISGKPFANLPASVDLSPGFPLPRSQGDSLSCYAWATTYAIRSFQKQRELGWGYGDSHIFSPAFMHNQYTGSNRREKEPFLNFLNFLVTDGAVPWLIFPFIDTDEKTQPSAEVKQLGRYFRILGFRTIEVNDIYPIKAMLASGEPVGIDVQYGKAFKALRKKDPVLRTPVTPEQITDGHHMVAVGYDDKKHALKVMNSWGPQWGDGGFAWIDYDIFTNFVHNAWVLYDRPTPPEIAAYLKDPSVKPTGPIPVVVQDEAAAATPYKYPLSGPGLAPEIAKKMEQPAVTSNPVPGDWQKAIKGEPVLIVPEEAGIMANGAWLRLGEPMGRMQEFFSAKTSPRLAGFAAQGDDVYVSQGLMGGNAIGRIDLLAENRLPIKTNLGIGFGSSRAKVQKAYNKPDASTALTDTYFYQPATSNWGGLKVVTNAAMEFFYDDKGLVRRITLFTAFKQAYSGQALKAIPESEHKVSGMENVVTSPEGHLIFTVPAGFSKVNKAVWPGIGVGYFITENTVNPMTSLTIKVFEIAGATQETLIKERIPGDLESQRATDHKPFKTISYNGIDWILAEDPTGAMQRYYTLKNGRIYQAYVFSNADLTGESWVADFLKRFQFQP